MTITMSTNFEPHVNKFALQIFSLHNEESPTAWMTNLLTPPCKLRIVFNSKRVRKLYEPHKKEIIYFQYLSFQVPN